MAKYKNISGSILRFNPEYGKEKIVDVDGRFTAEPNDFLDGAVALGNLELLNEPEAQPAKATESPKNDGK